MQVKDAADHLLLLLLQQASAAEARNDQLHFFRSVWGHMTATGGLAEEPQHEFSQAVERADGVETQAEKEGHGPGDEQGGLLGARVSQGLGDELSQHHQECGHHQESDGDGNDVRDGQGGKPGQAALKPLADDARQEVLTEPAHQQADDGHAELGPRNHEPDVFEERLGQPGPRLAFPRELFETRPAHAQKGILGRGEKSIERDKTHDEQAPKQNRHIRIAVILTRNAEKAQNGALAGGGGWRSAKSS